VARLIAACAAVAALSFAVPAQGEVHFQEEVGPAVKAAREAIAACGDSVLGARAADVDAVLTRLEMEVEADRLARFGTVARHRSERASRAYDHARGYSVEDDIDILEDLRANVLGLCLGEALGDADAHAMLAPIDTLIRREIRRSREDSEERLRRFEVRYGPRAPRLNALESGLQFLVFQRIPGFGPVDSGPGWFEWVSSYSPTYGTQRGSQWEAVSVVEIGIRTYIYAHGWGREGWMGMVLPSHVTVGFALADADDGALRFPNGTGKRKGVFVSWGDLKVACLDDSGEARWLVSRQVQLIPHVF